MINGNSLMLIQKSIVKSLFIDRSIKNKEYKLTEKRFICRFSIQ